MKMEKLLQFTLTLIFTLQQASGNFNFFVDKEEFHRITGATRSIIYLVRDGVVNEYALGHVMNVPYHIQYLDFKWQATGKRPVHYELLIEFSDFFALLQPSANISKVGRLPHKLETFRIHLPCSGRLTTEVPVTILFTFNVKHAKHNTHNVTEVRVKRNKICLLNEENTPLKVHHHHPSIHNNVTTPPTPPPTPPPPSLLLAGLLGGCAVSASVVSVLFFICLRKRLNKLDNQDSNTNTNTSSGSIFHQEESPACLIRKWHEKNQTQTTSPQPPPLPAQLPNSYLTSASFWSNAYDKEAKEVSPYAYAQIVPPPYHQLQSSILGNGHIYANHLSSFSGQSGKEEPYENFGSTVGSSSLIQIDGFQCGKQFVKEQGSVVERFL